MTAKTNNDDLAELQKRSTDITQLFDNVREYLGRYTLNTYITTFGDRITSGNFAQSGVYSGKPHVYVRVVKTFIFFGDVLCDEPAFMDRRDDVCPVSL